MKRTYIEVDTRVIADLAPPGELSLYWHITRINVPQQARGHGLGSKMLDLLCREADEEGAALSLEVQSSGPLDDEALRAWYGRRGFVRTQYGYLVRPPRTRVAANAQVAAIDT